MQNTRDKGSLLLQVVAASVVFALTVIMTWSYLPINTAMYPDNVTYTDPYWYREIAEGRLESVIKPFSLRILAPTIVRGLASTGYATTDQSFFLLGLFSLAMLVIVVTSCLQPLDPSPSNNCWHRRMAVR